MGEDTDTSPHMDKGFDNSANMDQDPNESTLPDGCVKESPRTEHDDVEDRPQFENRPIEDDDEHPYWAKEYAGHVWNDDRGWRVLKPGSPPEPWWIEDPPPKSPSDPDYLCDVCRHINFCWLFENNMPKSKSFRQRDISIGTVKRVLEQDNCSFCKLLASTQRRGPDSNTVSITSKPFSEDSMFDCNHPESEVRYLSVRMSWSIIGLQIFDDSRPMRGRKISPYIKQQQHNIARQWLEKCEHEHFSDENEVLVPNLALIDLNQRCIVRPHGSVRYAALSYVWGQSPQKMYSTSTQQEFETKGALHSEQGFLPQTITDAMDLAAHIGLDYLWVDSLCILQDDEADKIYFISKMGSIYGASAITIVDANGDHAGSGLVGMSSPREDRQRIATVQGMQLCTTTCFLDQPWIEYEECAWLQRGWTYQEMLLSKRLLLATHTQLQFVCNHAVYLEETRPHSPRTSDWTMPTRYDVQIRRPAPAGTPISYLYYTAVEMFTRRVLSYDMDVVPAFDAIFKALYKNTEAKSLFNLPDVEIEDALLWRNGLSNHDLSRVERRRHPDRLPTWSWAGWRGIIEYYWRADAPLISTVSWRCAPTSAVNKPPEFSLQEYRCANWREKGWHHKFLAQWGGSHAYTHDSRPNVFFQNPIALEPRSGPHNPPFLDSSNLLHFSAFTIPISASTTIPGLCLDDRGELRGTKIRHILDGSRYLAGSIYLDCLPANEVDLRLVSLARCSKKGTQQREQHPAFALQDIAPLDWDPQYFKNISPPNDIDKPDAEQNKRGIWDEKRFQNKFYPLYIVLLVELKEGIAYRIGIGEVHIDAFHAANPIWEEVRLG